MFVPSLKISVLLILAFVLSACGTKTELIVKKELVPVTVNEVYFKKPEVPTPPNKEAFMKATDRERIGLLKIYSEQLLATVGKLFAQIDSIESEMNNSKQIIEKGNSK